MKRLLTATLALSLLTGTAAMAQPDHRDDHGGYGQRQDNHGGYGQSRDDHGDRGYRGDRGGQHHWARGQRLPTNYYNDRSHYVDYRSHHLRAPPRGYRWVQTDDNNYAMVAITTGLIASLIAANR
jgi:Ni/Co efflux regulator RcnB